MKIIIINGVAQSGKDTFIKLFEKHASTGVANISTIDPVKELMEKCGWAPDDKNDAARKTMALIKQALVDLNDGPFLYIQRQIESIKWLRPDVDVVFVHVREPEEIEKMKRAFGNCQTLLVKRDVRVPDNSADQGVMNFKYDLTVENDGTERSLELEALSLVTFVERQMGERFNLAIEA